MSQYTIRPMSRPDLDLAVEWAAEEGWNPGLDDAGCFYAADPSGFLMGFIGTEPVASISAVKYGDSFGFVGFYIVKKEHRGKGYGIQLWNAAMNTLLGRTVGLDGVVDQQGAYRKSGFAFAYNNIRYEGVGGGVLPQNMDIVPLNSVPIDEIVAYDAPFFPAERRLFLDGWIRQRHAVALGLRRHGRLSGYGVMRPCRTGWKIGPLFADSPTDSEELFSAFKAHAPQGDPIYLDIPETNQSALDLVKLHEMRKVFETARMYRGPVPNLPVERIYGVTTFELG